MTALESSVSLIVVISTAAGVETRVDVGVFASSRRTIGSFLELWEEYGLPGSIYGLYGSSSSVIGGFIPTCSLKTFSTALRLQSFI